MKKMRIIAFFMIFTILVAANVDTFAAVNNVYTPRITVRLAPSPGSLPAGYGVYTGNFGFRIDSFPEPTPPRGYFFIGWFAEGTQIVPPIAAIRSTTVLAGFAPFHDPDDSVRFVVIFDPNGGELPAGIPQIQAFTYGGAITNLPTPTKEGYRFAGWQWEDEILILPHIVRSEMVLEATWSAGTDIIHPPTLPIAIPQNQYVIAFNPYPGAFAGEETGIRFGRYSFSDIPDPPQRSGAVFSGWSLPDGSRLEGQLTVREDMMLTALWDTSDGVNGINGDEDADSIIDTRPNPQSSPIAISFALFFAVVVMSVAAFWFVRTTRLQAAVGEKYHTDIIRYVREVRILIRSKKR